MAQRIHLPVLDRRSVLRGAAAGLLLAGCGGTEPEVTPDADLTPMLGVERCGDAMCIRLADPSNAALRTVEGARVIELENRKYLVVRTGDTTFAVLSAICTHQGCVVRYNATSDQVVCPCHGSRFSLSGSVMQGPALRSLERYSATYDAVTDTVTVTL